IATFRFRSDTRLNRRTRSCRALEALIRAPPVLIGGGAQILDFRTHLGFFSTAISLRILPSSFAAQHFEYRLCASEAISSAGSVPFPVPSGGNWDQSNNSVCHDDCPVLSSPQADSDKSTEVPMPM